MQKNDLLVVAIMIIAAGISFLPIQEGNFCIPD